MQNLYELDWNAIAATDFRDPDIKERKQAEFLVYDFFPFEFVERIGVFNRAIRKQIQAIGRNTQELVLLIIKLK